MFRGAFRSCVRDQRGAVGPAYAVGILALVAIAGIGFDYGRLASLDSELQNGADQAALAGATQLDGEDGACSRAFDAAKNWVLNNTRISNVGSSAAVTFVNTIVTTGDCSDVVVGSSFIKFYRDKNKAPANDDSEAHFIEVMVDGRAVNYALTPLVGRVSSGLMQAAAMAGIGTAICRSPPVMMCNPEEAVDNTDTLLEFPGDAYRGVGIRLVANGAFTPGSFGFLETNFGTGANNLLAALGWETPPGDCIATDGVEIKNGLNASVMDGIRSRFDVPGAGQYCPTIGGVAGNCPPSVNSRKDLVRGNNCNGVNAWNENASTSANFLTRNYRPTSAAVLPSTVTPQIVGYPRDLCHAFANVGNCDTSNGGKPERFGTGDWDINAYWRSNYGGAAYANQVDAATYGPQPKGYPTRYQVYRWEADHIVANDGVVPIVVNGQGSTRAYAQPQSGMCLATADAPYGIDPASGTDRRRLTVAVLNCQALQTKYGSINSKTLEVGRRNWVDVFLTEPPMTRNKCTSGAGCNTRYTEATDVYVEVIQTTEIAGGGDVAQTIRRDVPYLVE